MCNVSVILYLFIYLFISVISFVTYLGSRAGEMGQLERLLAEQV